jgi:hypothetical protein
MYNNELFVEIIIIFLLLLLWSAKRCGVMEQHKHHGKRRKEVSAKQARANFY